MSLTLLEWLDAAPPRSDINWQMKQAAAIREWCFDRIGFQVGDRVRIAVDLNINSTDSWGWMANREMLAVGATGVVRNIDFNPYSYSGKGAWHAEVRFDREWSTSEWANETKRYWVGPLADTPDGWEPPYDHERYPEGRKHTFSILVDKLARIGTAGDGEPR